MSANSMVMSCEAKKMARLLSGRPGAGPLKDGHHELLDGGVGVNNLLGLGRRGGKELRKGR